MAEETPEKIFIIATHGPEDPERASFPFVMANAALVLDVEVSIALQGVSVLLAQKGVADHIFAANLPPMKELVANFFAQGGKMLLCTPCLKQRDIDPELLIEGAEMVAAARVVTESLEANSTICY